jgi:hypothetical protein
VYRLVSIGVEERRSAGGNEHLVYGLKQPSSHLSVAKVDCLGFWFSCQWRETAIKPTIGEIVGFGFGFGFVFGFGFGSRFGFRFGSVSDLLHGWQYTGMMILESSKYLICAAVEALQPLHQQLVGSWPLLLQHHRISLGDPQYVRLGPRRLELLASVTVNQDLVRFRMPL